MKLYKPLFSIIIIVAQLILSLLEYYNLQEWRKMNPELDSIIDLSIRYDTLFLFVFTIGIYEMLTKPSWFKTFIRILLICIVLSYNFLGFIPIEDFRSGIYNVAWFSAFVALVLILFQLVKYGIRKTNDRKLNKASR